jgi:hypothetical protein
MAVMTDSARCENAMGQRKPMDIQEYGERLKAGGYKVVSGSHNSLWVSHGRFAMQRQPFFALHLPSKQEIQDTFHRSHSALLSFVVEPSRDWPANSRLYLCADREYSLARIPKSARSQIRRGLSEFEIRSLDQAELIQNGAQAYCDTLARIGLSGETPRKFEDLFNRYRPDRRYIGAIKENRLAAFLLLTVVDDWISIAGFSATDFLPLCPNNALIFHVVHEYLANRKFRLVTYGLSSIQAVSNEAGLERFKKNMGFQTVPVHRAFVVNPLLRPLANRVSWRVVNFLLQLSPQQTLLKKAEGALRMTIERYNR